MEAMRYIMIDEMEEVLENGRHEEEKSTGIIFSTQQHRLRWFMTNITLSRGKKVNFQVETSYGLLSERITGLHMQVRRRACASGREYMNDCRLQSVILLSSNVLECKHIFSLVQFSLRVLLTTLKLRAETLNRILVCSARDDDGTFCSFLFVLTIFSTGKVNHRTVIASLSKSVHST